MNFPGQLKFGGMGMCGRFVLGMAVVLATGCGTGGDAPQPDTVAPSILRTEPKDGASDVSKDVALKIWFDEAVDNSRGGWDDLFHLRNTDGSNLYGNGSYDLKQHVVTLKIPMELSPGKTYTAVLEKGVCDMVGNCMADSYTWTFTVAK